MKKNLLFVVPTIFFFGVALMVKLDFIQMIGLLPGLFLFYAVQERVVSTEAMWVVLFPVILFYLATDVARLTPNEIGWLALYSFLILAFYMVAFYLKKSGFLEKKYEENMASQDRKDLSVAVSVLFVDLAHLFLFFSTLIVIFSVIFFMNEKGQSVRAWWPDGFRQSFMFAGIVKGGDMPLPKTVIGNIVSIVNVFLGAIFVALWIAIWHKSYDEVFKFFRTRK